ncbi:NADH-quinone oxidoreductase subunit L [Colwellia sp. M166]|uniref:NADH-quinone oxidoreductase subunit L n=1 Tax=Colwellia sp. M166 TaxID=2583805 RepID=UPI00211E1A50|nr:NADH-quinone oxidoreductase subunit L [Colwellia sp. M166]UUO22986.1 NADH-quinone oxidoreductase subunit L [Colwellia sp. M166]|tara:strand:- start:9128 stop:11023 length:1896 start_codon:yes stop_codon:yes gene_type:complete
MNVLLASLPFYPFVSFLLLIVFGKKLSWRLAATISVSSMAISALVSAILLFELSVTQNQIMTVNLWHWFELTNAMGSSDVNVRFYLDGLSAVMISVVTGVGFLIHLFAAIYMKSDANFSRFMAYMNLFIVAMLILVLADNLVLLYLGWEGVGLCSFLLIGFWYQEQSNVLAARKAFIVTRIGDTSMAIGLLLLFNSFGQLNIEAVTLLAQQADSLSVGANAESADNIYWIALLLLGGAVGKSAQLPLQTWLPDAMAGPTPVSALIHAATMVTAGVYLIARMHGIFLLAPQVMNYVAWLGALTLLLAGIAALAQTDIKRVLAYSTMSQIGYMMLALGAGAWTAGVFHLMTHAFFKALLFLTAGAVIYALHHQQNLFKMGGLLKKLPFESSLFIIGLICLMALPGTSGFFSKEAIIAQLWSSDTAGPMLWWCAILGALLTSIYSCRLFFLGFLGKARFNENVQLEKSTLLRTSLIVLALLSLFGGLIPLDLTLVFSSVINLPLAQLTEPTWLHSVAIVTPFIGIVFSWFYFKSYRIYQVTGKEHILQPNNGRFVVFCRQGLGFDGLYKKLFIMPYQWLAQINKNDIFDQIIMLNAWYVGLWHDALVLVQNGSLRWYLAAFGLAIMLLLGVSLL